MRNSFLLLFFIFSMTLFGGNNKNYKPYPQPGSGYVSDIANLLTDEEEERIEQWLWKVEEQIEQLI